MVVRNEQAQPHAQEKKQAHLEIFIPTKVKEQNCFEKLN
jgi:hypothetical protein